MIGINTCVSTLSKGKRSKHTSSSFIKRGKSREKLFSRKQGNDSGFVKNSIVFEVPREVSFHFRSTHDVLLSNDLGAPVMYKFDVCISYMRLSIEAHPYEIDSCRTRQGL